MKCLPQDSSRNFRFSGKEPSGREDLKSLIRLWRALLCLSWQAARSWRSSLDLLLVLSSFLEVFSALMDEVLGACFLGFSDPSCSLAGPALVPH